jgi:hypothetical protein
MHTDDIRVSVVGVDRTVRALRCWHSVTVDMNLCIAIAATRQIGTSLAWLGFEFFISHGVLAVQHAKLLRAREAIVHILSGESFTFDALRSLMGHAGVCGRRQDVYGPPLRRQLCARRALWARYSHGLPRAQRESLYR